MRSVNQSLWLAALMCVWCTTVARAQSNPVDARSAKPVVMLLVDSSGSMERLPNTEGVTDQLPDCSVPEKNRWSITLEALTGTFVDYGCTEVNRTALSRTDYDYGYHLPHHRPTFSSQNATGVLDVYVSRAKFGLMTFDTVATYVDGPVFENYTALVNSNLRTSARGMYSYGNVGKLVFPGCNTVYGIDNGARNESAPSGRLVSPGVSDDAPDVLTVNQTIQRALVGTADNEYEDGIRPFGGTPVAGMLDDLDYFLDNDPAVSTTGDPYNQCRNRYAVLITDGVPDSNFRDDRFDCDVSDPSVCSADAGEPCTCPYEREVEYVRRLCAKNGGGDCTGVLNAFYVVALSLSENESAVDTLNELAEEGGTEQAYLADDATELAEALREIMNRSSEDATARTSPVVFTNSINTQFELTAGFRIPVDDSTWEGVLERQRWACEDGQPVKQELSNDGDAKDLIHLALESQSTRNILVPDVPASSAYEIVRSEFTDDVDSAPYNGETVNRQGVSQVVDEDNSGTGYGLDPVEDVVVQDLPDSIASEAAGEELFGTVGDLDGDGQVDEDDYDYALRWLRGDDTAGRFSKLGGIYHSQPVVIAPPVSDTTNGDLNDFLDTLQDQPEVVVVATADGLLHAFSLEVADDPEDEDRTPGKELWAIAPPAVMPNVPTAVSSNQLLFDGSPIVRNLTLKRQLGTTGSDSYRRVMIVALRGLPAFVAFDVTDVTEPKFLWQYTHPMMGETVGQPSIAQLAVEWNDGEVYERAVALLPGGSGETASSCDSGGVERPSPVRDSSDFRCWKHRGRYLYAVDVATGSLLQVFDHNIFPAPLTGGLAVDAGNLGIAANAAYVTDADGVLYRVDFSDPDPTEWQVDAIWDVFHDGGNGGRPALYPPLLKQNDDGQWTIVLGTGDIDNLSDSIAHRVVSLREEIEFDGSGDFTSVEITPNWEVELQAGEAVTGPLKLFDDIVYFASFVAITDPDNLCQPGESRIWGLHFENTDEDDDDEPLGGLFTDVADLDTRTQFFDESTPGYGFLADNLLVGVSIAQQPTCFAGDFEVDTYLGSRFVPTGAAGGGEFSLRAIVSGGGGDTAAGSSLAQAEVAIPQPQSSVERVPGGFGTVLE